MREQHPARADGARDETLADHADADCGGRVVAATGRDRQAAWKAEVVGHRITYDGGDLRPFIDSRQPFARYLERVQDLVRPAARPHVQQQRAGRIRGVGGPLAAELQPDVVLRQQDARHARMRVRFLSPQPQ